jgi:hypothetical protein
MKPSTPAEPHHLRARFRATPRRPLHGQRRRAHVLSSPSHTHPHPRPTRSPSTPRPKRKQSPGSRSSTRLQHNAPNVTAPVSTSFPPPLLSAYDASYSISIPRHRSRHFGTSNWDVELGRARGPREPINPPTPRLIVPIRLTLTCRKDWRRFTVLPSFAKSSIDRSQALGVGLGSTEGRETSGF